MAKRYHPLHESISDIIEEYFCNVPNAHVYRDPACGKGQLGNRNLPMFFGERSNKAEFTNVDLVVTVNSQIKLICEIDESNVKPNHIFGKYLSIASSNLLGIGKKLIRLENKFFFLQILDKTKLKEKSNKTHQWKNIELRIKDTICIIDNHIKDYAIISGTKEDFDKSHPSFDKLIKFLRNCI